MKLSYRGVPYNPYNHQPTMVDMADSGVTGHYRGQQVYFRYPRHIPVPQPTARLQYRGVPYQTTATGSIAPAAPRSVIDSLHPEIVMGEQPIVVPLPLATKVRRVQAAEVANVHLENIRKRLQHRIEVARANGNESLLHQLEDEMNMFA